MANFACCKSRPIPAYYICQNCLNIYHRACAMKNRSKFKFLTDHKIECCDFTKQTDDEISLLEQTIGELNDETEAKNRYIEKQKKNMKEMMQEAERQEEEMNHTIIKLERELAEAKKRIMELDGIINSFVRKEKNTISTQTTIVKHVSADSQTTFSDTSTEAPQIPQPLPLTKQITGDTFIHRQVPKILIVANSLGRNLATFISELTTKYQCQSIIKPGALNMEIIKAACTNTKNFTKRDIVIVWTSRLNKQVIDEFILKLKHTNPIVLTKLYQYDENGGRKCFKTYLENLNFFKTLHYGNINMKHVLDCNAVLRRSNYNTQGQYIRNIGKWYICKRIVSHIENNFNENEIKHEGKNRKHVSKKDILIPRGGEHKYSEVITEVESTQNNQLYPNLQEISLLENTEVATVRGNLLYDISNLSPENEEEERNRREAPVTNKNFLEKNKKSLMVP